MPDCYRHPVTATHQLDRDGRDPPTLPLCTPCADALTAYSASAADALVSPI